eukprot:5388065-Pleurochrysis_carterae.AAC.1
MIAAVALPSKKACRAMDISKGFRSVADCARGRAHAVRPAVSERPCARTTAGLQVRRVRHARPRARRPACCACAASCTHSRTRGWSCTARAA